MVKSTALRLFFIFLLIVGAVFLFPGKNRLNFTAKLGFKSKNSSQAINVNTSSLNECLKNATGWHLLGPSDGQVKTILKKDTRLFIGTRSGGIFVSDNAGLTWTHFDQWINLKGGNHVNDLKLIDTSLYAATEGAIYKLEGDYWQDISSQQTGKINYSHLQYQPLDKSIWALGYEITNQSDNPVLYRYFNNQWTKIQTPSLTSGQKFNTFMITNSGVVYLSSPINGLFISSNNGTEWTHIFSGVKSLTENVTTGTIFAINYQDLKIYSKGKDSSTFSLLANAPTTYIETGILESNNNILLAEGLGRIYVSLDDGATFESFADGGQPIIIEGKLSASTLFWDIRDFFIDGNKVWFAHDNGVSTFDLRTKAIKKLAEVPNNSEVQSFHILQSTHTIISQYWDHATSMKSSLNCHPDWSKIPGNEFYNFFGNPESSIYLTREDQMTYGTNNAMAIWSTNAIKYESRPLSNIPELNLPTNTHSIAVDINSTPNRAYALAENWQEPIGQTSPRLISFNILPGIGDYFFPDGGEKYKETMNITNISLPFDNLQSITIDPKNEERLIITTWSGGINLYESKDKGNSWQKIITIENYDIPPTIPFTVINPFDSDDILVGGFPDRIFRIKNSLQSIIQITSPGQFFEPNKIQAIAFDTVNKDILYIGTKYGFFYSTDGMKTLKTLNSGLYSSDIRKIMVIDDKIFVGIWGSGNAVILKEKLLQN